ncbi:MAG TPA: PLP-dependent transferase, partial [Nocardioidaceae bacterium]|nr:PLP-dependent transferase [Nocardioidaceae bacterium]
NLAYIIRARTVLLRNTGGAVAPLNSWLFLQGLETLHLRMERHSENALQVARFLEGHDAVSWVSYPGLDGDAYKETADRTLLGRGYGGLVSFGVKTGREGGKKFVESLELFSHLANIGDTKSLAIHNATTTHSQLTPEELEAAGVPEDMVRLSIGIEHVEDILADLEQALAASK